MKICYDFKKNKTEETAVMTTVHKESYRRAKVPEFAKFIVKNEKSMQFETISLGSIIMIELEADITEFRDDSILFYTKVNGDKGISIKATKNGALEIILNDSTAENALTTEDNVLTENSKQTIAILIDGSKRMISAKVDRVDCKRKGKFGKYLCNINGEAVVVLGCENITVDALRMSDEE